MPVLAAAPPLRLAALYDSPADGLPLRVVSCTDRAEVVHIQWIVLWINVVNVQEAATLTAQQPGDSAAVSVPLASESA
jgi:hypothetical protein